jgi:hypothetical protein
VVDVRDELLNTWTQASGGEVCYQPTSVVDYGTQCWKCFGCDASLHLVESTSLYLDRILAKISLLHRVGRGAALFCQSHSWKRYIMDWKPVAISQ